MQRIIGDGNASVSLLERPCVVQVVADETECARLEAAGYTEVGPDHFALPTDNVVDAFLNVVARGTAGLWATSPRAPTY